ncbi:lipoyl(octanoyl) transferase LipB [Phaeocystidibacter luteus]|uniref:Octanoyltransferase n=1 Tax=Phaeocystidibacter luteus TaxID=911197 RepID=A0A6N6RF84_9FLAO|nr:lipoyl(octanoyl) transferase LipB [Phaeocystidibacter luteus]KAB2808734.1 lipoyl(octanoyl) transferase LipB [Phaeocystidibacter luteus]
MMRKVRFEDLGTMKYKEAWDYQEQLFDEIVEIKSANRKREEADRQPTQDHLLFVHHPHVYTLGKSGKVEHLLINEERMAQEGIDWYKINRGGDITYHGPGQLVGYPIFDLDEHFTDIHKYLRYLEEAIILTMAEYGLKGDRSKGETGVWLDVGTPFARKICAMGVRASRWVTMHGFAFNVNVDMKYFDYIVPCGIADKAVTSLDVELGYVPDMEEVKAKVKKHLADLFTIQYL